MSTHDEMPDRLREAMDRYLDQLSSSTAQTFSGGSQLSIPMQNTAGTSENYVYTIDSATTWWEDISKYPWVPVPTSVNCPHCGKPNLQAQADPKILFDPVQNEIHRCNENPTSK